MSTPPILVVSENQPRVRTKLPLVSTDLDRNNGRVQLWIGIGMVSRRDMSAPSGTIGGSSGTELLPPHNDRPDRPNQIAQLKYGFMHQPAMRDEIPSTLPLHMVPPSVLHHKQCDPNCGAPCRQTEHHGRCSLQGISPQKLNSSNNIFKRSKHSAGGRLEDPFHVRLVLLPRRNSNGRSSRPHDPPYIC